MTTTHAAERQVSNSEAVPAVAAGLAVLVSVAAFGAAAAFDRVNLAFVAVAAVAVLVGSALVALRHFAWFFAGALVVRPLLDLAAAPRDPRIGLTEVFGLLVMGVCFVWLVVNHRQLLSRRTPMTVTAIIFLVAAGLSVFASTAPAASAVVFSRFLAGVVVFVSLDVLLSSGILSPRSLVLILAAVAALPVAWPLLGLAGVEITHEKDGIAALKSVFFLSNNFAYFLLPYILVGVACAIRLSGRSRLVAAVTTAGLITELVFTGTRGAWLAAAMGVLVVAALTSRRLVVGIVVGLAAVVLAVPPVNTRMLSLIPDPDQPRTQSSLAWRLDQWSEVIPLVRESPVVGIGLGQSFERTGKEPHNDHLRSLVDAGVLGYASYVALLGAALATSWRAFRRSRGPAASRIADRARIPRDLLAAIAVAVFAYVLAITFAATGDNLIDNVTFLWGLMPLLALTQWIADEP